MTKINSDQQFPHLPQLAQHIIANWPTEIKPDKLACYVVGLSGGVDSVVLLHIFRLLQREFGFKLQAIHVNHHISINAGNWQQFCENLCHQLEVPLTTYQHHITKTGGESLENNARKMRYKSFADFFTQHANSKDKGTTHNKPIILLAHHQQDQIETILSQVFRGSDLHNIAGMHMVSYKGNQQQLFWRPLLNISKQEILAYATQYNLKYVEDESNTDTTYLRNFIRQDILPRLYKWDPHLNRKLLSFNQYVQTATALIDELAHIDFINTKADNKNEHNAYYKLEVAKFKQLSIIRQHNLISYFILLQQKPLPSTNQINEFCRQVMQSAWDSSPALQLLANFSIRKYKDHILIQYVEN